MRRRVLLSLYQAGRPAARILHAWLALIPPKSLPRDISKYLRWTELEDCVVFVWVYTIIFSRLLSYYYIPMRGGPWAGIFGFGNHLIDKKEVQTTCTVGFNKNINLPDDDDFRYKAKLSKTRLSVYLCVCVCLIRVRSQCQNINMAEASLICVWNKLIKWIPFFFCLYIFSSSDAILWGSVRGINAMVIQKGFWYSWVAQPKVADMQKMLWDCAGEWEMQSVLVVQSPKFYLGLWARTNDDHLIWNGLGLVERSQRSSRATYETIIESLVCVWNWYIISYVRE